MDLFNISQDAWQQLLLLNGRVCVVFACCLLLIQWQKSNAATRHFLAACGLIAAAVLPWLYPLLPAIDIVVEVPQSIANTAALSAKASDEFTLRQTFSYGNGSVYVVLWAYMAGATFLLSRILFSNLKVFALTRLCEVVSAQNWQGSLHRAQQSYGITRKLVIKHSNLVRSPATCGVFRPIILLPSSALQWSPQLINSTLLHELAHIKRSDWLAQQLARVVCAVYWFNPLAWLTYNKLSHYAESASDDLAINAGIDKANYANDLVTVASQLQHNPRKPKALLTMATSARCSELKQRVLDIVSPDIRHIPMTGWQKLACFVLVGLLILPLASLRTNYIERIKETASIQPQKTIPVELTDHAILENNDQLLLGLGDQLEPKPVFKQITKLALEPQSLPKIADQKPVMLALKKHLASTAERQPKLPKNTSRDTELVAIKPMLANLEPPSAIVKADLGSSKIKAEKTAPQTDIIAEMTADIVEQHAKLNMIIPRYPNRAQHRGIEGEVKVEYSLDKFGKVTEAQVVSAQPPRLFDRQVLKAIKKSTYHPRRINGQAVAASGLIEKYVFVIES